MRLSAMQPLLLVALLVGCVDPELPPYYEARNDPQVTLEASGSLGSEVGNAGGNTLTIRGSGFGSAPSDVMVLIGNHNARVLSVTDSELVVVTPVGPVQAGKANVVIATATGYLELKGAYEYGVRLGDGVDPYELQDGYVLVQNYWMSCYGGMGLDGGCEDIAYVGTTGLDARSEFFGFSYPRLHTAYSGFITAADYAEDWAVYTNYDIPSPGSSIENLRKRVSGFAMVNPEFKEETVCVDLSSADYAEVEDCQSDSVREYSLDRMEFCEVTYAWENTGNTTAKDGPSKLLIGDWPVRHNFFEGPDGEYEAVDVSIEAEDDHRLAGVGLKLPGIVDIRPELGFKASDEFWAVQGLASCPDDNGDGETTLDENGMIFSWTPAPEDLGGPDVQAVNTYLHISLTHMNLGWFGPDSYGVRASIVVPDDHGYDPETGRSYVAIPNTVLYQFPSTNSQWSGQNDLTKKGFLGTTDSEASYLVLEVARIADYKIQRAGQQGTTVFSYVTGDFAFADWTNPTESTSDCYDCLDGDGDGWSDQLDPDCARDVGGNGLTEDGSNTGFTCNDGLDNNQDGLIDFDDPLCTSGFAGETNCGDGKDNDGDGWVDGLDGECPDDDPFASELGEDDVTWLCANGLDDDGDGWSDARDPGCADGTGLDEGGLSDFACNNGLDDDGDGYIDADDPFCASVGGGADSESPELKSQCADGSDNDADGFVDAFDPDCEFAPHTRETRKFMDPLDSTQPWFGFVTACYDGVDNDGDGAVDGADPSCWYPAAGFVPNGWLDGEDAVRLYDSGPSAGLPTGCTDGLDGDADGWLDGGDPDCKPGSADTQEEVGFGTTQCNDGIDNDGDGKIDAEDSEYCKRAGQNFEGPS